MLNQEVARDDHDRHKLRGLSVRIGPVLEVSGDVVAVDREHEGQATPADDRKKDLEAITVVCVDDLDPAPVHQQLESGAEGERTSCHGTDEAFEGREAPHVCEWESLDVL
jgi:hypothetical protein